MANQTTQFKRTVSGTINSGMRSMFGGDGRRYFIIEHKDDSPTHRQGEQQKLIVDEVLIGRDKKCQVLIDEKFGTVSREHAVIVRTGDQWKIVHQSSTNDTFVNGQRVASEQILQNGDEIQLSYNGPRLGFIIPQGEQSYVKSIGMTARMDLFRKQALRPYRTAITLISLLLLLVVGGAIAWGVVSSKKNKADMENIEKENAKLQDQINANKDVPFENMPFEDYVYYIKLTDITITAKKGTPAYNLMEGPVWTYHFSDKAPLATGFITEDGVFITARHVIEPWAYLSEDVLGDEKNPLYVAAVLIYEGKDPETGREIKMGGVIDATYQVESKTGDRHTFHFRDFTVDQNPYKDVTVTSTNRDPYYVKQVMADNDYAYSKTSVKNSNIKVDKDLSTRIPSGKRLNVLGFPNGIGADPNNVRPQYTYATTSNTGLLHGQIPVTGANYEKGNSGGPVFCEKDGEYYVVGVVSSRIGQNGGVIIPISSINY